MIKAVFFDCDGVLVDSERYDQSLNVKFLEAFGLDIDPKLFYVFVGSSPSLNTWDVLWPTIADRSPWPMEEFREKYRTFRHQFRGMIPFRELMFPDVVPTLRYLKEKGLKLACASSSSPDYIEKALTDCGIREYFDLQVSGYDFKKSKPDPEIYLHCRDRMGLASEECLVIEDSPYGIAAAVAAGMPVLGRRDTQFGMDQSGATELFDSMDRVRTYLEEA